MLKIGDRVIVTEEPSGTFKYYFKGEVGTIVSVTNGGCVVLSKEYNKHRGLYHDKKLGYAFWIDKNRVKKYEEEGVRTHFEVGTKVKVKDGVESCIGVYSANEAGVIVEIDKTGYYIKSNTFDSGRSLHYKGEKGFVFYIGFGKVEEVKEDENKFSKKDLKVGMLIKRRNGLISVLLNDRIVGKSHWDKLDNINDDLTSCYKILDIVEVRDGSKFYSFDNIEVAFESGEVLFKRDLDKYEVLSKELKDGDIIEVWNTSEDKPVVRVFKDCMNDCNGVIFRTYSEYDIYQNWRYAKRMVI